MGLVSEEAYKNGNENCLPLESIEAKYLPSSTKYVLAMDSCIDAFVCLLEEDEIEYTAEVVDCVFDILLLPSHSSWDEVECGEVLLWYAIDENLKDSNRKKCIKWLGTIRSKQSLTCLFGYKKETPPHQQVV